MNLTYHSGLFHFHCPLSDSDLPSRAGFSFDRASNVWVTPFASVARKVSAIAGKATRELINRRVPIEQQRVNDSHSVGVAMDIPTPKSMVLRPYQKAGVKWVMDNDKLNLDSIIGDDMGLGKTPQAICACTLLKPSSVLIVCPASIKINWKREWKAWSMLKLSVGIASGKFFPDTDVVIINYDVLDKQSVYIKSLVWDVLILDEVQMLKNPKAIRTREVIGGRFLRKVKGSKTFVTKKPITAKRKIALTGTPIPNKIIEIYRTLNYFLPQGFPNEFNFAKRYCSAYRDKFGRWDFTGSSNLVELQYKLRSTVMIRRLKPDVLTDLPPKVRQVIELDCDSKTKKYLKHDQAMWARIVEATGVSDASNLSESEYRKVIKVMEGGATYGFEEISTIRKETAVASVPMVIEHLREAIEVSGKVVCFCWHEEVVKEIQAAFKGNHVTLVGSTPLKKRQQAVDNFQNNKDMGLFIGNIKAAGVGLTLTAASHVVFAELDWVPLNITQAEDRCHRYGQKDSVLVQHLVLAGSIHATMAKTIVRKQEIIEKALDAEADEELRYLLS